MESTNTKINDRISKAREDDKKGLETIEVANLPYEQYLWNSIPKTGTGLDLRFKLFYGIDKDKEIVNIQKQIFKFNQI